MCVQCGFNGEVLKCTACRSALYCSRACQRAGWKAGHRKQCSQVFSDEVPADAECYICLDGPDGVLRLGCACRGYAHLECVRELAKTKPDTVALADCEVCHQSYNGLLKKRLLLLLGSSNAAFDALLERVCSMPDKTVEDARAIVRVCEHALAEMDPSDLAAHYATKATTLRRRMALAARTRSKADADVLFNDCMRLAKDCPDELIEYKRIVINQALIAANLGCNRNNMAAVTTYFREHLDPQNVECVPFYINCAAIEAAALGKGVDVDEMRRLHAHCKRTVGPTHSTTQCCAQALDLIARGEITRMPLYGC